jgi:ATP-dependent RNA helicase DbpA
MSMQFSSLNLKSELIENLKELKFESMTPIQAKSLPFILEGKDVMAQAKTGSGKTAAFGLGVLNGLDIKNTRIQTLVLCPTRELADQVAKELRTLARMLNNIKVLTITGGKSEYQQEKSLAHGAHVIVGTPGRVLKLARKKLLFLDTATSLVLDEADRMLDMGFFDDILNIANRISKQRQTLLFSATFPEMIKDLGSELQKNAELVEIDTDHSKDIIEQIFFKLPSHKDKPAAILKLLNFYRPQRFLVFCKTKIISDQVAKHLISNDIYAKAIHGDLMQNERTSVLTMFSNRSLSALVATDVAARGLDIQDLEMVINYDLPYGAEIYVHRIGRTARAGKTGLAISFYTEPESEKYEELEELHNEALEFQNKELKEIETENEYDLSPPMKTICIYGGKKDKLRPGDIVGAIVGEAGINFEDIGEISMNNMICFVAIKKDLAHDVIKKLNAGKIKNRKFKVAFL